MIWGISTSECDCSASWIIPKTFEQQAICNMASFYSCSYLQSLFLFIFHIYIWNSQWGLRENCLNVHKVLKRIVVTVIKRRHDEQITYSKFIETWAYGLCTNFNLFCTQVVLFIDAAKVDETRLKELLRKGVEIEYGGRKVKKLNST